MTDSEKTGMLVRLFEATPHVPAELRAEVRKRLATGNRRPAGRRRARRRTARARRSDPSRPRACRSRKGRRRTETAGGGSRESSAGRGSTRSRGGAKASGARSRPKSSAATQPATTRRQAFSSISGRSPRNAARPRISSAAFTRSVNGMPERDVSSNGWRQWDSLARRGVVWRAVPDDDEHYAYSIAL